jgi:hypothetical protein
MTAANWPALGIAAQFNGSAWTDITPWVRSGSVTRPASRVRGPLWTYGAGTTAVALDNSDGRFDPDNTGSPYWDGGTGQTLLIPMVPVRVQATWNSVTYSLFTGFADSWQPEDGRNLANRAARGALAATDAQKVLAGIKVPAAGATGAGEDAGARVSRILDAASWYAGGTWRSIDAGDSTLQAYAGGDYAWTLMQAAADSEIGELYVSGAGKVTFRHRQAILTDARSNTPQAVFGDSIGTAEPAGTERPYYQVTRSRDDTTLANDIQATRIGGALQEAQSPDSTTRYLFPRTYDKSDLILQDDPTVNDWAQWVLYVAASDEDRFDSLTLYPLRDPVNLWPQALGREVGDRIQVWRRPPGVTGAIVKDCFIRSIAHAFDWSAGTWSVTWTLQSADKYGSFLVLDNATLGRLDHNALGF